MDEPAWIIGHLLRRAGTGATPDSFEMWQRLGFRGAVDRLLDELDDTVPPEPAGFDAFVPGAIQDAWLTRMLGGRVMLAEKLALFWHGHFATSVRKIRDPALMWAQYRLFRSRGAGPFRELLGGVARDVAMIRWLDGNANRVGAPNENWARELQELFTLGIGHYSEDDVRATARAFTGWGSRHHEFVFTPEHHDDGEKTIHGRTGSLGGDDVLTLLVDLDRCRVFLAEKLLAFFVAPTPDPADVHAVAAVLARTGGNVRDALRAVFLADSFRDPRTYRALVKSPVEVAVGALRATGCDTVPLWIHGSLARMGQVLFRPPSVKGWAQGLAWLSAGGMVERLALADRLAADVGRRDDLGEIALDGRLSAVLDEELRDADDRTHTALILGSPEFQLA